MRSEMRNSGMQYGRGIPVGIMLVAGVAALGVAADILPVDQNSVHAPRWVVGLIGVTFISGGVTIVVPERSRFRRLAAAAIVFSMAFTVGWVALFGSGDHLSGGLWFLPHEMNVSIGRWVFGLSSLMCFAIAGWALLGDHSDSED